MPDLDPVDGVDRSEVDLGVVRAAVGGGRQTPRWSPLRCRGRYRRPTGLRPEERVVAGEGDAGCQASRRSLL